MKWLRWESGRQQSGYHKLLILQAYWLVTPLDLYLLRYPPGSSIPQHNDPVPGYRHYRINIVLKKARSGGAFKGERVLLDWKRLKVFRSDFPHEVLPITQGTRYVLFIGLCLKNNERSAK